MCLNYISEKCPKLFTRLEVLQNIVRYIALFEGILGLIALTVKLTLMILNYESAVSQTEDEEARQEIRREDLTHIVVLSVYVLQAAFALILFEGARRRFLCMIKAWLFFCFFQLLIPVTMILCNVFLWKKKRVKIMLWILVIQVSIAIFHGIEAIFVLAFHQGTETERRQSVLTSFEYHKCNKDKEPFNTPVRKHSDASFSVQIDSDHESES